MVSFGSLLSKDVSREAGGCRGMGDVLKLDYPFADARKFCKGARIIAA